MFKKIIQASALGAAVIALPNVALAADDGTVAHVNGEAITKAQVEAMMSRANQGKQPPQLNPAQRAQIADRMVEVSLLAQKADDEGLADDAEIQAQLETTRRLILARAMVEKMSKDESLVSDKAVRDAYDEQYQADGDKEELHARHILVEDEDKAKDLIKQLDNGADFAKLAAENSTGPTKNNGGDLGWFARGEMVPTFSQAAAKLDEGSYTEEPVQTKFGWHVIKLEGRRDAQPPAFEEVKQQIRGQLANEQIGERIKEMRKDANIEISDDWKASKAAAGADDQPADSSQSGDGGQPADS